MTDATGPRTLIVNADDFGRSAGTTRGIVRTHEHGIVTSASLMVRWPEASPAAAYARVHPALGVGLHIDLGEWSYRDETWVALYSVVPFDDEPAVRGEIERQLESFRALVGRDPTHLDSHQHVHREEPILGICVDLAKRLGVVVRHFTPSIHYCGAFYGQGDRGASNAAAIRVEALLDLIAALAPGVTELACHPGELEDLDTMYRLERPTELETLCDSRVRNAVEAQGIRLANFEAA